MKLFAPILALLFAACSQSTPPRPPLTVSSLAQLESALSAASTRPATVITLAADLAHELPLVVQGVGTVIRLAGHRLTYTGAYNGVTGGPGIDISPTLGETKPLFGETNGAISETKGYILCNADGNAATIERLAGGNVTNFVEPVPVQYGDEKLRGTYTLRRPIQVRAENITIIGPGTLVNSNPGADRAIAIAWARGVTIKNVTFDLSAVTLPNSGCDIQESENVTFIQCLFGNKHVAVNATHRFTMSHCSQSGTVSFEECSDESVVEVSQAARIQVGDATCHHLTFNGNTLSETDSNLGAIALSECGDGLVIDGNDLGAGVLWHGHIAGTLKVSNNRGGDFYSANGLGVDRVVQAGNVWTRKIKSP